MYINIKNWGLGWGLRPHVRTPLIGTYPQQRPQETDKLSAQTYDQLIHTEVMNPIMKQKEPDEIF